MPTRTVTTTSAITTGPADSTTNAAVTKTTTTYGSYGLPLTQTVTGKHGATSVTTDTLSADGKTVKTVTTAVGAIDTQSDVTAQNNTVTSYNYNKTNQVSEESVT